MPLINQTATTSQPILFDFDHTLFDTDALYHQQFKPKMLELLGCDLKELELAEANYIGSLNHPHEYHSEGYVASLAEYFGINPKGLQNIIFNPSAYVASIFPEVISTLQKLQLTHPLGIYSQGNVHFQMQKLELSGLVEWFLPEITFIAHDKSDPTLIEKMPSGAVVIDDKEKHLLDLKRYPDKNFTLFLIDRAGVSVQTHFTTVKSLTEFQYFLAS